MSNFRIYMHSSAYVRVWALQVDNCNAESQKHFVESCD